MQKACKKQRKTTFFHHWTAICLWISTWSTSVNGSKQCSKIYCFFQWEFIIYFTYFIGKIRFILYLHYYVYSKNVYIFHEKTSFSTKKCTISNNISSKDTEATRLLVYLDLCKKCTRIHDKNIWKHVSFCIFLTFISEKN